MKDIEIERRLEALLEIQSTGHHGLDITLRRFKKEFQAYKNHKNAENTKSFPIKNKLNIGCGKRLLEEYTNVDINEPADIICDLRQGIPIQNDCIETIFSEHFFEHLDYPISTTFFLEECYRVLKLGGQCIIGVPDTEILLKKYVVKDDVFFNQATELWYKNRINFSLETYIDLVNYHMRDQADAHNYEPHFWGYDFQKLLQLLKEKGFHSIKKWQPDKSICNPKRIRYSLYVSANK